MNPERLVLRAALNSCTDSAPNNSACTIANDVFNSVLIGRENERRGLEDRHVMGRGLDTTSEDR